MVAAIRQHVIVQPGGNIALQSADLPVGESVEVIVMVEQTPTITSAHRLAAFRKLRSSINLDPPQADRWAEKVRIERVASQRALDG